MAAEGLQRQACIAQAAVQRVADPQRVTRAGAVTPQCLARRNLAKDGDAQVQRAGSGVATHQADAMRVGQVEQPLGQAGQEGLVHPRQRQRQREGHRLRAAGGQIAQVDGQRLVAQPLGSHRRQEVPAFDQHVAGDGPLHAGGGLQQRAVVAHAQHRLRRGAGEVLLDQVEFAKRHGRRLWLVRQPPPRPGARPRPAAPAAAPPA